jgi:hypothetical protein
LTDNLNFQKNVAAGFSLRRTGWKPVPPENGHLIATVLEFNPQK